MTALAFVLIFAGILSAWSGITGHSLFGALSSVLSGKSPSQ